MSKQADSIVIASKREKWRLQCPEGHDDWRVWNGVFSCETCRRQRNAGADVDPIYEELQDAKTGAMVPRDQIEFLIDVGQPLTGD